MRSKAMRDAEIYKFNPQLHPDRLRPEERRPLYDQAVIKIDRVKRFLPLIFLVMLIGVNLTALIPFPVGVVPFLVGMAVVAVGGALFHQYLCLRHFVGTLARLMDLNPPQEAEISELRLRLKGADKYKNIAVAVGAILASVILMMSIAIPGFREAIMLLGAPASSAVLLVVVLNGVSIMAATMIYFVTKLSEYAAMRVRVSDFEAEHGATPSVSTATVNTTTPLLTRNSTARYGAVDSATAAADDGKAPDEVDTAVASPGL